MRPYLDLMQRVKIRQGLTPEMVAAVSKIMRNQDLILVAKKCQVLCLSLPLIFGVNRLERYFGKSAKGGKA